MVGAAGVERRRVRGAVDALGETAGDREARRGQRARETRARWRCRPGWRCGCRRSRSAAATARLASPATNSAAGAPGDLAQQRREIGLVAASAAGAPASRSQARSAAIAPRSGARSQSRQAASSVATVAAPRRVERARRGAVALEQLAQRGGAEPRRAQQDQPGFDLVAVAMRCPSASSLGDAENERGAMLPSRRVRKSCLRARRCVTLTACGPDPAGNRRCATGLTASMTRP